ncbi:hypothetical protein IMZ11_32135 [Microtetraspora sp. AC03309]|uniref:hypothetical protein n=1 Tax=Microtetraspora sp. AC03309 TaxID=2779376 RepID=UPI001E39AFF1|nr:hypothetical protein [Microtetraspora sp. AC03309]MCC5580281.1 hypothetical protein [Microtetraspora sp. AC03309]
MREFIILSAAMLRRPHLAEPATGERAQGAFPTHVVSRDAPAGSRDACLNRLAGGRTS